jgi:hypothetical protein
MHPNGKASYPTGPGNKSNFRRCSMKCVTRLVLSVICLIGLFELRPAPQLAAAPTAVPLDWYTGIIQADTSGMNWFNYGVRPSIAVSPLTHSPHVSYYDAGGSDTSLRRAYRLDTPTGNCNGGILNGPSIGWQCTTIATEGDPGQYSAIAFEKNLSGNYGIAYANPAHGKFTFNRYNSNEQLIDSELVTTGDNESRFASLAYYGSQPYTANYLFKYVSYDASYRTSLVAYTSGSSDPYLGGAVRQYSSGSSTPMTLGYYPSIDVGSPGNPRIAFRNESGGLAFAEFTGSGSEASCAMSGGDYNRYWACSVIDPTAMTYYKTSDSNCRSPD